MVIGMGVKQKDLAAAMDNSQKFITCPVCAGAKTRGRKNRPCKTCKGVGVLPLSKFNSLFGIVKQELANFVEDRMRNVMQKYSAAQSMAPMPNEDLNNISVDKVEDQLQAELVSAQEGKPFEIQPKKLVQKAWTFKNTGKRIWPAGCRLVVTQGDNIAKGMICSEEVAVGAVYSFLAQFSIPEELGSMITYLQLPDADNQLFGQKVWCAFDVKEPEPELPEEHKIEPALPH